MNLPANLPTFQPVRIHERIQLMDALRGFSLLGILIVNTWSFSRYEWVPQKPDSWLMDVLLILIDTKFITIFSILFGAGFALQRQKALSAGVRFTPYFARRMVILFAIGCAHAYLLWFGDILRSYAILGFALLAVGHLSAKATLRLSLVFICILTPFTFILTGALAIRILPEQINGLPWNTYVYQTFVQGSYPQILEANWIIDPMHNFIQDMPITLVSMFGRMLLGVWLVKIGFFRNPVAHQRKLRQWLGWGSTVGIGSSIAFWAIKHGLLPTDEPWMIMVIFAVGSGLVLHSLLYIALFVRLYQYWPGTYILRFLVPVGRMALTNYLAQTVLAFALFYGTGTVGAVTPVVMLGAAGGLFAMQMACCRWWFSRHESGPVEWVWRRLAYAGTAGKPSHIHATD